MSLFRSLVAELREIMRDLWFHDTSAYSPINFLTYMWSLLPGFYGSQQHDAHEFLSSLLEHLNVEFRKSRKRKNRSTIQEIFQGSMVSKITCNQCEFVSKNSELFLDISLDVPSTEDASLHGNYVYLSNVTFIDFLFRLS